MGRLKVPMEYINNDNKRNDTFKTRKKGIIKKAHELSTLCGVNVSMIICTDHQEPEIFPPNPHKFTSMLDLYRQTRKNKPDTIRYSRLSDFFKEKTMKIHKKELPKTNKKSLTKYPTSFDNLDNFSEVQLREFASRLESKIDYVRNRIELLKNMSKTQNQDDDHTIYPNTVLNVDNSSSMPSLNPRPRDDSELFFNPIELLNELDNDCDYHANLNLQPPASALYLTPEILQQPEPPLFSDQTNLIKLSLNTDSVVKRLMSKDYNNRYNHVNSSIQPTLPKILKQPELPPFSTDQNYLVMQSSNPDSADIGCFTDGNFGLQPPTPAYCFQPAKMQSSHPDSMMELMMSEDDKDYYDHDSFSLQLPPPTYWFPPEILHQPN